MRFTSSLLILLATGASVSLAWEEDGACTNCWPGTSGYCKQANTVCYGAPGQTCLPGSYPCGPPDEEEEEEETGPPCKNTAPEGGLDENCGETSPICVGFNGGIVEPHNSEGDHCAVCVNSKRGGGGGDALDWGCTSDTPVCVGDVAYDLPSMVEGTACAVCFNSLDSPDACDLDDGCPPSKPVCANEGGGSIPLWTPGSQCVANCKNNKYGAWYHESDHGCHDEWKYCVLDDLSDAPENEAGTCCSRCTVDSCDDNNMCTTDTCDRDEGCKHEEISCDDNDPCTVDTCDPVVGCIHTPVNCDDGESCTVDFCDAEEGICFNVPKSCDDGDACTLGTCNPEGGDCLYEDVDCDDNNACTINSCDSEVGCQSDPVDCDDGNVCTADSCDPLEGCAHADISCDDGDSCTVDSCDPVEGCSSVPIDCDDNNPCTQDSCEEGECSHTPIDCGEGATCEVVDGEPTCITCLDNNPNKETDTGCDDDYPLCVISPETGLGSCFACLNDVDEMVSSDPDTRCDDANPLCVAFDDSFIPLSTHGDKCVPCKNTVFNGQPDPGCDEDKPLCVAANGENNVPPGKVGAMCESCPAAITKASFCFNIDDSGSINSAEYSKQVNFLRNLVDAMAAKIDIVEFSLVWFSTDATVATGFMNVIDTKHAIGGHTRVRRLTNIEEGVQNCDASLSNYASYDNTVLVTVTDGNPTAGGNAVAVAAAADVAQANGHILVSVGVGDGVDASILESIADDKLSQPVDSFDALDDFVESVATSTSCLG